MPELTKLAVAADVAALAFSAAAAASIAKNLVKNGSFEEPVSPEGGFTRVAAGETFQGGWHVVSGSVDVVRIGVAARGAQWLDLNGATAGALEQDVATTPGQQYRLKFFFAANPDSACGPPRVVKMRVTWNNADVHTLRFDTTGHGFDNMGWSARRFSVTASGASTNLRFESLTADPPECGPRSTACC